MSAKDREAYEQMAVCDICHQQIRPDESRSDDGHEIAHATCVRGWYRRNFGRETL